MNLLQSNLYPTVGLQTPGEVVDANFGQAPFVFDIEDMMKELKARTKATIDNFPFPENYTEHQRILHRLVFLIRNFDELYSVLSLLV